MFLNQKLTQISLDEEDYAELYKARKLRLATYNEYCLSPEKTESEKAYKCKCVFKIIFYRHVGFKMHQSTIFG